MEDKKYDSMTMQEKIDYLKPLVGDIQNIDISEYFSSITIDFGKQRGQGKRSNGTIKGGMGSFYGPQTYSGFSLEEYLNDFSDEEKLIIQETHNVGRYLKARKFGLEHKMSIAFSKLYYYGKLN